MEEYEEYSRDGESVQVCPNCGYEKDSPAKEAYHLAPGSVLHGKYIVGKVLGYGGFGVTYMGYDAQLDRKIAVKEYLPTNFSTRMPGQTKLSVYDGENGEQFHAGLDSFINEAKRLSKLNALPGTVDIYDSFLENGTGYIVMEFLDGKTVKNELTENGVFEYETAKAIILKILETLKEVHKAGLIHRDIAPDNIFLLKGGDVRLIDFGASRYATTLHSKSLSVILKPGYAPEEQYRSRGEQGPWSDIYALAATFYKMITGITPEESMERRVKDNLKEPSKAGVVLSPNDENAIMNALLVKASDRTQSAEEFERQLTAEKGVDRAASTIEKYDAGLVPKWARTLAVCLGVVIAVFGTLVLTGTINLQSGAFLSTAAGAEQLAEDETRVPNVMNEKYESASQIAEKAELLLVVTNKEYSEKVEADTVMQQSPLPGRVQLKTSALNVVISAGVEAAIIDGVMPDIVFRTLDDAIAMLKEAGIKYQIKYEESDTVVKGNIISADAIAGDTIANGNTVTIVVSDGSDKQGAAIEKAQDVYFVVTFLNWDGMVLSIQNVMSGGNATAPGTPSRSGYRFTGWDRGFSHVGADMTVRAMFEKLQDSGSGGVDQPGNSDRPGGSIQPEEPITPPPQTQTFTVTFVDWNGTVLKTQTVNSGESATPPSSPSRTGYTFTVWSPNYTNITGNLTVTANYRINTYTVTWVDWNGAPLKIESVQYGGNTQGPAPTPTRTGYTFTGWSPTGLPTNVTANMTITAQYTQNAVVVNYAVNFIDWNNTVLKTQTVQAGGNASAPANPTRAGYTFTGWSTGFTNVNSNLTVYAQYVQNPPEPPPDTPPPETPPPDPSEEGG